MKGNMRMSDGPERLVGHSSVCPALDISMLHSKFLSEQGFPVCGTCCGTCIEKRKRMIKVFNWDI